MPNENNAMLFNSFEFILFLLPVLALTLLLNRSGALPWRNGVLLLASYAFYAWLNPWYPMLLLYITAVNYGGGWLLLREYASRTRYLIITVILLASLAPLAFCKYAPLFGSSVWLPIGLSFFTFQALSYSLDLYRQKSNIRASFADYALFVSFFPTLLSGPIERSRNLIPQLQRRFPVSLDGVAEGCQSFVWGLFKKVVIADRLAQYLDPIYATYQGQSGSTLMLAALLYSIQIYCDFSGYASMAVGVGRMMGIKLTDNFHFPYFAGTIRDFWRRWHISLTSWFTEYVYISMGGNRVSAARWVINIAAVFLLSGIWHGPTWAFVVWGGAHALLYLTEHALGIKGGHPLYGLLIFVYVSLAWVFFRMADTVQAAHYIQCLVSNPWTLPSMGSSTISFAFTALLLALGIVIEWFQYRGARLRNPWMRGATLLLLLLLISLFGVGSEQFVYFQF